MDYLQTYGLCKINLNDSEGKAVSYIDRTKQKIEDRNKEHKHDIKSNKSITAIATLNNKSPNKIHFNEKLASYNKINYALLKEVIEIVTAYKDMLRVKIDTR